MTAARVVGPATQPACDGWRCDHPAAYSVTAPADPSCPPRLRCHADLANAIEYLLGALVDARLDPAVTVTPITREG